MHTAVPSIRRCSGRSRHTLEWRSSNEPARRETAKRRAKRPGAEPELAALLSTPIDYIPSPEFSAATIKTDAPPAAAFLAEEQAAGGSQVARMCRTPLLTKEQEVSLFRRANYLKFLADRLRKRLARRADAAEPEDLDRLRGLLSEANETRNHIIRANLRLVIANAKRYVNPANTFDELVSEGSYSLVRAVEKYDYTRGNRFSTYATRAIRNNLFHFVTDRRRHRQRFPLADDESQLNAADDRAIESNAEHSAAELKRSLRSVLGRLDPLQRRVLAERFGLENGGEGRTLKDIAGEMGVSRERVRQIEGRALRRLRKLAEESHLDEHLPG